MIPEFIAYDRDKKEWVRLDPNGKQKFLIDMFGRVSRATMLDYSVDYIDIYPYIHRKDKDGNKVYEGSRVESEFGGLHTIIYDSKNCRYGSVAHDRFYPIDFIVCGGKVIGHIAEEG